MLTRLNQRKPTPALLLACLTTGAAAQENQISVPFMELASQQQTNQPAVAPAVQRAQPAPASARAPSGSSEATVSFGVFSAPIELTTLIEYVGTALDINIVIKGTPTGEISFNAPVEVPKSRLIELLDAMLEQHGYTIAHDGISDFWVVQPISDLRFTMGSERASTQIISTPNIKPSLIVPALNAAIGGSRTAQGNQGGAGQSGTLQAIDELGVIIINAPSRDIDRIKALVENLIDIDKNQRYIRFELEHVAAPVARERAAELTGGAQTGLSALGRANAAQGQGGGALQLTGGSLSNLAERIAVDPQGNALIFKGTEAEIARVTKVLDVIDVPNTLEPKSYYAGSSAAQIANIASQRGLGEVVQISDDADTSQFGQLQGNRAVQLQQNAFGGQQDSTIGGPVMVVNTSLGTIIYYGTNTQQQQLSALLDELDTEDERVVIREIVLNHSDAETVAELMTAIITGEQQTGDSDFLPGSSGPRQAQQDAFVRAFGGADAGGSDVNAAFDPNVVSVIADIDNNQVLIKAPIKQQEELGRLVSRLDRRTPQVYIEALIVSVSDTENFTLAFESRLNAGQFGTNTNFGLLSDGGTGLNPADLLTTPALGGFSAAIIMTEQIPLIINANQTDTGVRILSTPQLLVNDNQESEIVSIREEPFTEVSQGDGGNVTGFAGFAEAGTTLRVTPSISDGGYLRLEYFVELSNFTSSEGVAGSPPPRDRNTIEGTATVPSDATIVIGGITVDNLRNTESKIPLLGDIPLVGELFKDRNKIDASSKLYVFLTPRIMTDPNFQDLRLLSEGPYAEMELDPLVPELESARITSSSTGNELPEAPVGAGAEENDDGVREIVPVLAPVLIDPSEGTE